MKINKWFNVYAKKINIMMRTITTILCLSLLLPQHGVAEEQFDLPGDGMLYAMRTRRRRNDIYKLPQHPMDIYWMPGFVYDPYLVSWFVGDDDLIDPVTMNSRSVGSMALAGQFVLAFLDGSVPVPPQTSDISSLERWETNVLESYIDRPNDPLYSQPSEATMLAETRGELIYWGTSYAYHAIPDYRVAGNFRIHEFDHNKESTQQFDPDGRFQYMVWSGYMCEVDEQGAFIEHMIYDLIDYDGTVITTPLWFLRNRSQVGENSIWRFPETLKVMYGVSPVINWVTPTPPRTKGANNTGYLGSFYEQTQMVGTSIGSGLHNYEVVGAVTREPLALGDMHEPFTYTRTFVPDDTLSSLITGNQYTGVGTGTLEVTITDYAGDKTIFDQPVMVYTLHPPNPRIVFAEGAKHVDGTTIPPNSEYAHMGWSWSGGEDGWTNQPLRIELDPRGIITGNFDTVLTMPDGTILRQLEGPVVFENYQTNTPFDGATVWGGLNKIGSTTTLLSPRIPRTIKIDTIPPIAGAIHTDGLNFTDTSVDVEHPGAPTGSGIASRDLPRIAIVSAGNPEPDFSDYVLFEDIPNELTNGKYDVWVWARDKAGNTNVQKAYDSLELGSQVVTIRKDTDEGAMLHSIECTFPLSLDDTNCGVDCVTGAGVDIEEYNDITYNLYIENLDADNAVSGTFEDYLPKGVEIDETNPPTFAPVGSVTNFAYTQINTAGDPNEGRWKVSGNYTNLVKGMTIQIIIPGIVPEFDEGAGADNIFRNQATMTWEYEENGTMVTGNSESNFTLHRTTKIPSAGMRFTKVGVDALTTGLDGAEFALYRLDGTDSAPEDIVNPYVLEDEDWTRVKLDGEDADSIDDVFVSSGAGEVILGELATGVYTLIETKAPTGYALPVGQWTLIIDNLKNDNGAGDWKMELVGKSDSIMPPAAMRDTSGSEPMYRIINARAFSLGIAGLAGTRGIRLIGFAMIATAGTLYVIMNHRKRTDERNHKICKLKGIHRAK